MDKYIVDKVVGEGSFGKALLCRRKADQRKCIIKQISLKKMSRKEAAQTEQESQLLARLKHPNIVTFWESFSEPSKGVSYLWIVMDFADGGDLDHMIKARRGRLMSETQAMQLFVQIALAMKHVHDRKILHRDLKTQNIFMTKAGIVKLGDFGIARVLRNTGELASTQIGTPYYMSPEIMNNKRYNSKTDIWSLGCVLYELLTLKVPFEGNSMPQLVRNIINGQYRPISNQYSQPVRDLVKMMLTKDPKDRPGINAILGQPVVRGIISNVLDQNERQSEFSHTILHGEHILKKAPLPVDAAAPAPLQAAAAAARVEPKPAPSAPSAPAPAAPRAQPVPVPGQAGGEVERLRAEAEKMRLRMEQMAKERCAAVDAERRRLAALKEKERLEVHRMQVEKEARDKARREEKARKMKEYEQHKADEAARLIREARAAADKRRAQRDRPWAQPAPVPAPAPSRDRDRGERRPPAGAAAEPLSVAGQAQAQARRAAPAWLNNAPARKPAAPSPSNAVREASPRNRSPSPADDRSAEEDADQYMRKLRERLKQKDEERRQEKQAELSRLREKEKRDREDRERQRLEQARQEKERQRAAEQRAAERKASERLRQEELEERLREERAAERRRQEQVREEKDRLRARAEEAKAAEKKRLAAEQLAVEKDRLRAEKDKLAQRLEERERERQRREQDRRRRLDGEPLPGSPRGGAPSVPSPSQKGRYGKAGGHQSDSSEEGPRPTRVTPAAPLRQPRPNLDWLANLEDEMGQLKGELEKLSPHIRGGAGAQSPVVRGGGGGGGGGTPSGDGGAGLKFFKKHERPPLELATPPQSAPSPHAPSREKIPPRGHAPTAAKSPRKPLKERSVSERAPPAAAAGRAKKPVAVSMDDQAEAPPWRRKPAAHGARPGPRRQEAPPSAVGESASVASLDDRREKRERDRADLKKFLDEKRNAKPPGRREEVQVRQSAKKPAHAVFESFKARRPNPEWVADVPEPDEPDVDVITLPEEPRSEERPSIAPAAAASPDMSLSITIENNNAVPDTPPGSAGGTAAKTTGKKGPEREQGSAEKKKRIGLSSIIANIFGPRKKVIPGVSPKVRLQSPKIKINSPKLKAKSPKAARQPAAPAWMRKDGGTTEGPAAAENAVTAIQDDPHAWSSEGICGDYLDYNLATGPLPTADNAASNAEYQELLDSMRLALEDAHAMPGPVGAPLRPAGAKMDAIVEENDGEDSPAKARGAPHGQDDVSDDETFEESSVSLSGSEEEEEEEEDMGSDWSVDNSGDFDAQEAGDAAQSLKRPTGAGAGAKPLAHFVSKSSKSNNLSSDFDKEPGGADSSAGLQSTLYGVPISLSASMKKEMSNLASYGPSVRIETLRIVLEDRLGEGPFLEAYRYLRGVKDRVPLQDEAAEEAEEERLLDDMERMLGTAGLKYLDLLYELITAEENF